MKRLRTAISLTLLATLGGALTAPTSSKAEWVQNPMGVPRAPGCDPGYSWQKVGVRYQCVTPQPSCAYGFASGPAWNGSTWVYSCNAPPPPPPPPTCPSGYDQIVAPSWNGSAWVGQICQPHSPTPDNPPNLKAICTAAATKQLGSIPPWQDQLTQSNGGVTTFQTDEYMGSHQYYWETDACSVNADGTNPQIYMWGHGNDMGG
jgi:hypothetical protein